MWLWVRAGREVPTFRSARFLLTPLTRKHRLPEGRLFDQEKFELRHHPPGHANLPTLEAATVPLKFRERAMAMFEGPDRNRNIIITVVIVVVVLIVFLYATGRLPGF